jgi:hypothetical protein
MTKGYYGGGAFGFPTPIGGLGVGLYMDSHGRIYPKVTEHSNRGCLGGSGRSRHEHGGNRAVMI